MQLSHIKFAVSVALSLILLTLKITFTFYFSHVSNNHILAIPKYM